MKKDTKRMIYYALLIGLTTVMTMVVHIPTLATKGYLNLGDMVVILSAILLGKRGGLIVGGLGSSLADILLAYPHYAPITLIVKGLEGFLCGFLLEKGVKPIFAAIISGLFMATGYLGFEIFMYGKAAFASYPGNILQGLFGALTAILVYKGIEKTGFFREIKN